jgi:phosphate:Na+ symporter
MRIWLRQSDKNRSLAAGTGMGAAVFFQSFTAIVVLLSNFES